MRKIVDILMERDELDRESAIDIRNEMRDLVLIAAENGDIDEVDDILADYGFEPDYIEELLF